MEPTQIKIRYPVGKPDPNEDVLWRLEAKRYSIVLDPEAERYGTSYPELEMSWFIVTKRTPCGAWIHGKFIRLTAHKKWACNTEADAIESFRRRKKAQISILQARLKAAKDDLALLNPTLRL